MKTVSCCFAVFLVTTNPATSVIYSLKFVSVLQFLGTNFLTHLAAVTAVKINLYYGLVSDSWTLKMLKIEPLSKET